MSNQFKNRLVGLFVVACLGGILLPSILDGKKPRQQEKFTEIPLRPQSIINHENHKSVQDLSTTQQKIDQNIENKPSKKVEVVKIAKIVKVTPHKQKHTKTVKKVAKSKAKKKSSSVSHQSYSLRVGSFKNAINANALIKRLKKDGFHTYSVPKKPIDGQLTRIFIGPDTSKSRLQRQQAKLDKLTKLKSKIVILNPTK